MSAIPIGGRRRAVLPDIHLSHFQATPLLEARATGQAKARTSVDLNLTMVIADLTEDSVVLADGRLIPWRAVEAVAKNESGCFIIEERQAEKIQTFSVETGRVYTLYPTPGAPTMLVSGVPMHRIKGTNPYQDTLAKLRTIAPVEGVVLDTCTGLGYTACQAARSARRVLTIELDPAALEIARMNPWSQELFDNPKIEQLIGDAFEVLITLDNECFDAVIHDPPQFSLAGDLYSGDFYRRLLRGMKPGGKLFHYIGDPDSKSGASVTRSVIRRLTEVGFRNVTPRAEAFGVTAVK